MNRYQNLAFSSPAGYGDRTAYESRPADEARVREILSALPMELQAYLNETLLPLLNADYAALKSAQGAGGIGAVPPALGYGATVQAILDKLQAEIVNTALGQIPNGGVTREKLAADIRGALYKTAGVADETAQYLLFPATMTPAQKQAVEADPAKLRQIAESALTAPIGSVKTQAFPPEDPAYLPCDGRPVSPGRYSALFQKLGYRYGKRPVTGTYYGQTGSAQPYFAALGKIGTAPDAPRAFVIHLDGSHIQWYTLNDLQTVHDQSYTKPSPGVYGLITNGSGVFLTPHTGAPVLRSTDLTLQNSFTATSMALGMPYDSIYYKGKFVFSDKLNYVSRISFSEDGLAWTTQTVDFDALTFHIFGDALYVLTYNYVLKKTTDLIHWETLPPLTYFNDRKGSYYQDWTYFHGTYYFVSKRTYDESPIVFSTEDFKVWKETKLTLASPAPTALFLISGAHLLLFGKHDSNGYLMELTADGTFQKPAAVMQSISNFIARGCADGNDKAYLAFGSTRSDGRYGVYSVNADSDFLIPQSSVGYLKAE